jgi:hypothetical protein
MYVPISKDGSAFGPHCAYADGKFRVGPKGAERTMATVDEALVALKAMTPPYFRRPNGSDGTPGIVRGLRWEMR